MDSTVVSVCGDDRDQARFRVWTNYDGDAGGR